MASALWGWAGLLLAASAPASSGVDKALLSDQASIRGGSFLYGSSTAAIDEEATEKIHRDGSKSARRVRVHPFSIDKTAVTNAQFRAFVRATKFVTDAEKYRWSFVLDYQLDEETLSKADGDEGLGRIKDSPQWVGVVNAYWRQPEGPKSSIKGREQHPVVHVSYNDAVAYCSWAGRRLPSEIEWEFAARGGINDEPFPWGGDEDGGRANGWQGPFPHGNTAEDGYASTAPVDAYSPNRYGLYNTVGNVWEWTSGGTEEKRPLRGGSFIDSIDGRVNHPLRVSTRMDNTPDSASSNTGFRCAGGDAVNEAPRMDQERLQEVLAEKGVEGLTDYIQSMGKSAEVLTADQLADRRKQPGIVRDEV